MKFDNIIIGGGLSGMIAGIALAREGKHVAIVSAGQSTLHFGSGSFDLLGYDAQGHIVDNPFAAIGTLPATHPYQKVGAERVQLLAMEAVQIFNASGLHTKGSTDRNHFRVTPLGTLSPTWLTLDDYLTAPTAEGLPYRSVLLVDIPGFLDFPTGYIAHGLESLGTQVLTDQVTIPVLSHRRNSPSEMRSANLAKVLQRQEMLLQMAQCINAMSDQAEAIVMPAIVGLDNQESVAYFRSKVKKPLHFMATLPPSVPGVRVQTLLRKYFARLGGTYMLGNAVTSGHFADQRLEYVHTSLLADERLYAEDFVLASGSFQSEGLKSNYERVYEPIFDLDVSAHPDRTEWTRANAFDAQPYMEYGVQTNKQLQTLLHDQPVANLYAAGSVMGGHNPLRLADGTGVSMITALAVAKNILLKTKNSNG